LQKTNKTKNFRKFLRFSGIGVQLGVLFYIASFFGKKIDAYYNLQKPLITMVFVLIALVVFIWNLIRQLNKLNQK